MIFLVDDCVTEHALPMLRAFGSTPQSTKYEIQTVVAEFGRGAQDTDWIPRAAARTPKPIILSGDVRRCTEKAKRDVIRQAGLIWISLGSGWTNTPWEDFSWKIVKVWPRILDAPAEAKARRFSRFQSARFVWRKFRFRVSVKMDCLRPHPGRQAPRRRRSASAARAGVGPAENRAGRRCTRFHPAIAWRRGGRIA